MRLRFLTLSFVFALLLCPICVASSSNLPSSFINELKNDIRSFIRAGDLKTANSIFADRFDMDAFGERCLIDHWSKFSSGEKERYKKLLEQNIKKRLNEKMIFTDGDADFKLVTRQVRKEEGVVKTENDLSVRANNVRLGIYLVKKNGKYFVADYDFDGVLLSRQYRGQFNRILRNQGKDAFFARLEDKLSGGS